MKIVKRKITELIAAEYNPRKINKVQEQDLKDSLTRFGLVDPIIININEERKNIVIGGHQRLRVWAELGNTEIDCNELDLTLDKERELNIRLNKNGGSFDDELVKEYFDYEELTEWGFTPDELFDKEETTADGLIDDDEIPEVKESKVKLGDIWKLGEHRVMCGDSTSSDDFDKLMNGEKADMVLTDPPYNISYKSGTWSKKRKQEMKEIKNDNLNEIDFVEFLSSVFSLLHIYSKDTDKYIFNDWKCFHLFREACIKADFKIKNLIVWNKEYQTQALNKFANAHEFIIFLGDNKYPLLDINVWNCKREFIKDHPTPKPIPLLEKAISYSSNKKELVLDMFLGSGSTLIAAEKLNRKCYGMELDEKYCDVIIERWEQFTGLKAEKING